MFFTFNFFVVVKITFTLSQKVCFEIIFHGNKLFYMLLFTIKISIARHKQTTNI